MHNPTTISSKAGNCATRPVHPGKPGNPLPGDPVLCSTCWRRRQCIAHDLPHSLVKRMDGIVIHPRALRKGKHLYWQGSPLKSLYIIASGAVKIYRISPEGKEQVLEFYLPGDMLGYTALSGDHYLESAITLDSTAFCELPIKNLSHLIASSPDFQHNFLAAMAEFTLTERRHRILACKSTDERVAAFLINLSVRQQRQNLSESHFRLIMTRKDIANYLGIAVETVSRVLTRFQAREWVTFNGNDVTLHNKTALEESLLECRDEGALL